MPTTPGLSEGWSAPYQPSAPPRHCGQSWWHWPCCWQLGIQSLWAWPAASSPGTHRPLSIGSSWQKHPQELEELRNRCERDWGHLVADSSSLTEIVFPKASRGRGWWSALVLLWSKMELELNMLPTLVSFLYNTHANVVNKSIKFKKGYDKSIIILHWLGHTCSYVPRSEHRILKETIPVLKK